MCDMIRLYYKRHKTCIIRKKYRAKDLYLYLLYLCLCCYFDLLYAAINKSNQTLQNKRCTYENVLSNHTFRRNKQAGVFTHLGHTTDIHQCKLMCCKVSDCDVAFMPENHCYAVSCYSDQHCETTPANAENFNVQLVKVRRVNIPNPEEDEPREEDIIRSSFPETKQAEEKEVRDEGI